MSADPISHAFIIYQSAPAAATPCFGPDGCSLASVEGDMRGRNETPSPARYAGAPGQARCRTVSALSCAYRERYGVLLADLMSHRSIHPVSRLLADGTSPSSTYCRPSTPREDQMRTFALAFSITVSSATS